MTSAAKKQCARCRRHKTLTEFHRCQNSPDGHQYRCKSCGKEAQRIYAQQQGVRAKRRRDPRHLAAGKKQCFKCDRVKQVSEFSPTTRGVGGTAAYCRPCMSRYQSSRSTHRAYVYLWRVKNRNRYLAQHSAHQQRRRACVADGTVTPTFVRRLYSKSCCHYCRRRTSRAQRTLDHKVPLSRNGAHSASNIVMACGRCNFRKSTMTDKEFAATRRREGKKEQCHTTRRY